MKDSNGLLTKQSTEQMSQEEYKRGLWYEDEMSSYSYGLGWDEVHMYPFDQYGIQALSKGGDTLQYHGSLIVAPQQNIAIAILSSGGSSDYNKVVAREILLSYLRQKKLIGTEEKVDDSLKIIAAKQTAMPSDYKKYSGTYANCMSAWDVTVEKNQLVFSAEGAQISYPYKSDGWFTNEEGTEGYKFKTDKNGATYIIAKTKQNYPLLGDTSFAGYYLQKLSDNKVSDSVLDAWKDYLGKQYVLVNEKYSSYVYTTSLLELDMPERIPENHYIGYMKIQDETTAIAPLQIPMFYGRDLVDLTLFEENNVKYIKENNSLFECTDAIKELPNKKSFNILIRQDQIAQYYKIGEEVAGKQLKLTLPAHSTVVVYDKDGELVTNTYVHKTKQVTLPEGGDILFVGDKNSVIKCKYR